MKIGALAAGPGLSSQHSDRDFANTQASSCGRDKYLSWLELILPEMHRLQRFNPKGLEAAWTIGNACVGKEIRQSVENVYAK